MDNFDVYILGSYKIIYRNDVWKLSRAEKVFTEPLDLDEAKVIAEYKTLDEALAEMERLNTSE